jgi:hypothetical protein
VVTGEGGGVSASVPHEGGRRKERGAWRGGGRFGAVGNGRRARATPCHANRGAWGLSGGPQPQCRAAAPADRQAGAAQCQV